MATNPAGEYIFNYAVMLRSRFAGAIILPERCDDARFYERHRHPHAVVLPAAGPGVMDLLADIQREGIRGIAAVPACASESGDGVFCPDAGGVPILLLRSESAPAALRDLLGAGWVDAANEDLPGGIVEQVVRASRAFRRIAQSYPHIDLGTFIRHINWLRIEPDHTWYRNLAIEGNPEAAATGDGDGSEALAILSAASEHYLPRGIRASRRADPDGLMCHLTSSVPIEELCSDLVFHRIRLWEIRNGFPMLNEWKSLDPLGAVLDQRYWRNDLRAALSYGSVALLMLDLDGFKAVNTTIGHSGGDDAIKRYATVVRKVVEGHGDVYRRGGDEIVVIAPDLGPDEACSLAEAIRLNVKTELSTVQWCEMQPLTVSIGVAIAPVGSAEEEVVAKAERAIAESKRSGKDKVMLEPV